MISLGNREFLKTLFNSSLDELPDGLNVRNIERNLGTFRELVRKVVLLASAESDAHNLHQRVSSFLELDPNNPHESLMSVGACGPRRHALDADYFRGMSGG